MPAGKHDPVKDGTKKVTLSAVNARRSLLDFPYKSLTALCRGQQKKQHPQMLPGYFKNKMKKPASNTIGVLVHTLQSHFIKSALTGMEEVSDSTGYKMVIMHSQESMEKEIANAQFLFEQQVDGLIASLSFGTSNLNHFNLFANRGIPLVFFDRVDASGNNQAVVIDNVGAGYAATHHLIEQGCKRIAIITSCLERNVYADRYTGFRNALAAHNIPFQDHLCIVNDITEEAGVEAARQIISMPERPDGLFITNDFVAASCMCTLMEYGIQVPADIAIVGFNNDPIGKLTVPAITTINYPGLEMGRIAAMQLINTIAGCNVTASAEKAFIQADLIVRHSSLKNVH